MSVGKKPSSLAGSDVEVSTFQNEIVLISINLWFTEIVK